VAFIFFRSASAGAAFDLLRSMAGLNLDGPRGIQPPSLLVLLLLPVVWLLPNTQQIMGELEMDKEGVAAQLGLRWKPSAAWAVAIAVGFFSGSGQYEHQLDLSLFSVLVRGENYL
jgi:hypothetical protein